MYISYIIILFSILDELPHQPCTTHHASRHRPGSSNNPACDSPTTGHCDVTLVGRFNSHSPYGMHCERLLCLL